MYVVDILGNPNQAMSRNVPLIFCHLTLFLLAIVDPDGTGLGRNQHPARLRKRTFNTIPDLDMAWITLV